MWRRECSEKHYCYGRLLGHGNYDFKMSERCKMASIQYWRWRSIVDETHERSLSATRAEFSKSVISITSNSDKILNIKICHLFIFPIKLTMTTTFSVCGKRPRYIKDDQSFIYLDRVTPRNLWPWTVGITRNKKYFCSGTLVSPKSIITSAKCFDKYLSYKILLCNCMSLNTR